MALTDTTGRIFLAWLIAAPALGLAPHEVAVVANRSSSDSLHVANVYCAMRGIPQHNLVLVSPPPGSLQPEARITPADFTRTIWEPVNDALDRRGIDATIRAWVYSVDMPLRVSTAPEISIQGITLVRNELPPPEQVKEGSYLSPFFAGPSQPGGGRRLTVSLDAWRPEDAPLPSMMLGHTGARGTTVGKVLAGLRRGIAADHTFPTGTVYFVETDDVRGKARNWQVDDAISELTELGVGGVSTTNFPRGDLTVLGIMIGSKQLNPFQKYTVLPGAFAENLTSFGGRFEHENQTKLTRWLEAGFTGSTGTVTEPYALWTKFPHARFHVHYARGATLMDSLYQSVFCPLQLLMVGEPLTRPFAPRIEVDLAVSGMPDGSYRLRAVPDATNAGEGPLALTVLVDGEVAVAGALDMDFSMRMDPSVEGARQIRAVVSTTGPIRHWGWADTEVMTGQRRLVLSEPAGGTNLPLSVRAHFPVTVPPGADSLHLLRGSEILTTAKGNATALELDPARTGLGPVQVQARAQYPDGTTIISPSIRVNGVSPEPPPLAGIQVTPGPRKALRFEPEWEGAPPAGGSLTWYEMFPAVVDSTNQLDVLGVGELETAGREYTLKPDRQAGSGAIAISRQLARHRSRPKEYSAKITMTPGKPNRDIHQIAGIAFNVRNPDSFDCFGYHLKRNAWVLGSRKGGTWTFASRRGRPFPRGRPVELRVCYEEGMIVGKVDEEVVCTWPDGRIDKGRPAGVVSTGPTVRFASLGVSPPVLADGDWTESDGIGELQRPERVAGHRVALRADNGYARRIRSTVIPTERPDP